jgi:ribonucleotide monophosphatase NagD (HAD superfamily)
VRLDDVRGFVLDVDGTLVHRAGEEVHVQPGAREVLERIRASGRPFAIFTNGSHAAPETFAAGLRAVGLDVADEAGLRIAADGEPADVVFVAHADAVDFDELERAARAVLAGAPLLTGSYAAAYAGANGPIISRGAMLTAAIAKASGARPVIVGKPSEAALETIVDQLGTRLDELAVIGDDLGMDVALGRLGGARTVLVRSGISKLADLEGVTDADRPDAVVDAIADLLDWL